MLKNDKQDDMKSEKMTHQFLDENFYFTYTTDYTAYEDLQHQYKGIDTSFVYRGIYYKCDEKATFSVQWLNKETPTLCLDILSEEYEKRGKWLDGWFVDSTHENNSLLYCYDIKTDKKKIEKVSDINEMKLSLVATEDVWDYLDYYGWNKEKIIKKANQIKNFCEGETWNFIEELNKNNFLDCQVGNIRKNGLKFRYRMTDKGDNVILQIPTKEMQRMAVMNKIIKNKNI